MRNILSGMITVVQVCMRILEVAFMVGIAGSAVVILISFVEDFRELFSDDEPAHEPRNASGQ